MTETRAEGPPPQQPSPWSSIGIGRLRTGRIGTSIVAHIVVNSLAMIATLVDLA